VHLVLRPDPESVSDVSADVADVLYRTAQEALTNAVRHGRATRIRLEAEAVGPACSCALPTTASARTSIRRAWASRAWSTESRRSAARCDSKQRPEQVSPWKWG